jgi:divalent metal cation (Fe/Co/Zn/Cd) transporter
MTEKTITLKGPWAFIALLFIGAFTIFQYSDRDRTLESDAVEVIKPWLIAEYTRNILPQLQEMVDNPSGKEKQIEALVKNIARDNIQIVSIQARGKGDDVAVQVEIEVDGKEPPDGKRIRYFRMSHSTVIGWQYEYEISKWRYYLTF